HDENAILCTSVENSSNILLLTSNVDVVGIDEAQFFDNGLVDVVVKLANMGVRVIVAGLDMNFRGEPFGIMPQMMAVSDFVTKLHAICLQCGNIAQFSHRITDKEQLFLLGKNEMYEPLCRNCFIKTQKKQ
ncbi:MAG: thymidine kinase, partial [Mariniphaga sp.]